jgi:gliding motility-associated-like protein
LFVIHRELLKAKKHILHVLVVLILFMASAVHTNAISIPPQIHCIAVDSVGDVTLTWSISSSPNFVSYNIYSSLTKNGPYANSATVPTIGQNSVTITGLPANGQAVYFYMVTDTVGGSSPPIDTLKSIFLTVASSAGRAILLWNAMSTPNLPSSSGWYKVYREFPQYVWTLIDSTQSLSYIDTITICNATINYKVEIADNSGCTSVSNRGGNTFSNLIPPPQAVMDTLSVTSANGLHISWQKSTKNDVIGYVIYEFKGGWKAIDTVWGINNLSYYDTFLNPDSASIPICVAALDSCIHVGALSLQQNSLFLTEAPDSCLQENLLSWTPYVALLPGVLEYKVWISTNNGPFMLLGTTNATTTTFLQTGLNRVATYRYFVQVIDHGFPVATASSNLVFDTVKILHVPLFSYLQTATVVNNASVTVNAYVDNSAHCTDYTLERSNSLKGPYTTVGTATSTNKFISISDPSALPDQQSYFYKVTTQNQCGITVDSTQPGQTMFLTAMADASGRNTLTWNDYMQWWMGDSLYYIYRSEDNGPFTMVTTVPCTYAGVNVYKDDISKILTGEGIFSYYVTALEKHSAFPFIDTSTSNIAKAYQDPRVYIPTAFSPLGRNKLFIPVGVFVDVTGYDFAIFDRLGQLLFETQDPGSGWNGTYGGKVCMEGVYVYHLVYTSAKGEYFDQKGTVTLIK